MAMQMLNRILIINKQAIIDWIVTHTIECDCIPTTGTYDVTETTKEQSLIFTFSIEVLLYEPRF